ncbi:hypothetical protein [Bradyrhizobium sp. NBAIM01]|uniref:hypothetical protein n=1 Tax=Bradyrhizobium sp. NBAIM01 TaxID=2793818 RepID=UPI001CD7688F|nr:hypothetical protein [Bradyrhizobium sp. NBAIM01]MCA1512716.1 hypothetical protein [Bradyrhizobium sp. NBAIM01]
MGAASHSLLIKYGLASEPSDLQVRRWADRVRELIRQGMARDAAGDSAAKQIFPDYRTRVYASEGDTIDTLLRLAEQK